MRLDLYINSSKVLLGSTESLGISFNREFTDLQNPEKRSADFSFTISLPKCPQNNRILEQAQEAQSIDKFNKVQDYSAELFADGRQVLTGLFRLSSISADSYKGNLYSDAISWADNLSGITLQQLTNSDGSKWLAPYNLAGAGDDLQSYQIKTAKEAPFIFPLLAYHPFPNTGLFPQPFVIDSSSSFKYYNMPPAVYYVNILKKCFESIGWEVSTDLLQDEAFMRLVLPYVGDDLYNFNLKQLHGVEATGLQSSLDLQLYPPYDIFPGFMDRMAGQLSIGTPESRSIERIRAIDIITKNSDDNAYNTLSDGAYNVNFNQTYNLKFSFDGFYFLKDQANNSSGFDYPRIAVFALDENAVLSGSVELEITDYLRGSTDIISNEEIIFFADFYEGYSNIAGTTFNQLIDFDELPSLIGSDKTLYSKLTYPPGESFVIDGGPQELKDGQRLVFYIATYCRDYRDTGTPIPPDGLWLSLYNYDSFKLEINSRFDDLINVSANLPEITARDFVADYMKLTNSFFITDANRRIVTFFTFDNLHTGADNAYKWEGADVKNAKMEPYASPKQLIIGYDNEGDDVLIGGSKYGQLLKLSKNIYSQGKKEVRLNFSATKYRPAGYSRGGEFINFDVANIMSAEQLAQPIDAPLFSGGYIPRLLQVSGKMESPGGFIDTLLIDGAETDIILTAFNGLPPISNQQGVDLINLRFDDVEGEGPSLFEQYYINFADLTNRGHLLELQGCLTSKDWQNMTFNKIVLFDSEQYLLISINNFNPLQPNAATVKLLKIV